MTEEQKLALCYQPLFEHLYNEYDIKLTTQEMDEIICFAKQVNDNLNKALTFFFDVEGCNETVNFM